MKKKKFKFAVDLTIQDLSSVPVLNGVTIFCKARLLSGGEFAAVTCKGQVNNHCVSWEKKFSFPCKLSSSISSGILDTCLCRVSVRKEVKGGKTHEKLGFVDINLAEYAGCGKVSRRYILDGYHDNRKSRQDNSILKVTVNMTLTSGDPLFKPQVSPQDQLLSASVVNSHYPSDSSLLNMGSYKKIEENVELRKSQSDSFSGSSSGLNPSQHVRSPSSSSTKIFTNHTRDSSFDKRISGLHPNHHSRQPSGISTGDSACADLDTFHLHSPAAQLRNIKRSGDVYKRIDETRVNADDIIDQLLNGADLTADTSRTDEGIDMSLFLETDGVSTMSKLESTKRKRELPPIEDRFKTL